MKLASGSSPNPPQFASGNRSTFPQVSTGAQSILFMDGPFEIRLQRVGQTTKATCLRAGSVAMHPIEIDPGQLLASAMACGKTLLADGATTERDRQISMT
jgi:hypothetical protein